MLDDHRRKSGGDDRRFRPSRQPTLGLASEPSSYPDKALVRHPGLAQPGEICGFEQGAGLRHAPPCAWKGLGGRKAILTKHVLVKVTCPMTSTATALPSGRPPKPAMTSLRSWSSWTLRRSNWPASRCRDQAFTPLRIMFGSARLSAALVILWFEAFWRHYL